MNQNSLQEYQNEWIKKFNLEAENIKKVLGASIKDIQHIGSTSIPGMIAKPIIDIGLLVDSIKDVPYYTKKLEAIGYSYKPDMSSVERIFLRKGNPFEYHLFIACPAHLFWARNVIFRDYLKNHLELADEYKKLKTENISITPEEDFKDLSQSKIYNRGKSEFVQKVLDLVKLDSDPHALI